MMQLGTTTLPLAGWVTDPRLPAEGRALRLAAIRQLVESYHLQAVELTLDLSSVYPHIFDAGFHAAVADLQAELSFTCTVHLPFLWVDASSMNQAIRRASVASLRQAIEWTRPLAVHAYVLHLWGFTATQIASELRDPAQRQVILGALMMQGERSLEQLCDLIDPGDLCVENLEDSLFEMALPVIERLGVSICLDVGHLAWQGSDAVEFLVRHRDRVHEVHLHDCGPVARDGDRQVRDHLPLGAGDVDYAAFLRKLVELGYESTVILEVNSRADLEQSLERVRAILPYASREQRMEEDEW
jgi:sugar phosphate isomerase/epimerase